MASLNDLKRAWLLRQLGLDSSSILSQADLLAQLYGNSNGVASNFGFTSGRYYGPSYNTTVATGVPTLNTMYCVPFPVGYRTTFDQIALDISAGAASSFIRLGIYDDLGRLPNNLVFGSNQIDTSSASFKIQTIDLTLNPGLYWLVAVAQGGVPTWRSFATSSNEWISYVTNPVANNFSSIINSSVSGALPDLAGATGNGGATISPRILMRAA